MACISSNELPPTSGLHKGLIAMMCCLLQLERADTMAVATCTGQDHRKEYQVAMHHIQDSKLLHAWRANLAMRCAIRASAAAAIAAPLAPPTACHVLETSTALQTRYWTPSGGMKSVQSAPASSIKHSAADCYTTQIHSLRRL